MTRLAVPLLALLVAGPSILAAGPRIDVVIGPDAPRLERFAARELTDQLRKLFDARVQVSEKVPTSAEHLILLGSPATNPAVKEIAGDRWPKLTDQGHLLRSVSQGDRRALLVGGGSPVATLWAVYELGHHFGIRYLLHGDVMPAEKPALKLDGLDRVLEPTLRLRTWRTVNDFAIGPESWGLAEQKRFLGQLAKLKFNRVMLAFYPWQPFVHYEFKGVKKRTAMLWYGWRYRVDGDTPGRAAFRGAKEFENPDFAGKTTYEEKHKAGVALASGIIDAAHDLGMSAGLAISPLEFPREFAAVLPGAKVLKGLEDLTIGPGPKQPPDDPLLRELAATQVRAYLTTYPKVDALYLTLPEFPDWVEHYEKAWQRLDARTGVAKVVDLKQLMESARKRNLIASGERGFQALRGNIAALDFFHTLLADPALLRRPGGNKVEVVIIEVDPALFPVLDKVLPPRAAALHFVDYTARRVTAHADLLGQVPARSVRSSLIFTLADDNVGVLPQLTTSHLHTLVGRLRQHGWEGFSTRYWIPGDLNPAVHYLSRAAFDARVTPQTAYDDLVTPICGEGVVERLVKAFDKIEEATTLIDQNDIGFTFPVPGVVMKHYRAAGPPPAWWKKVRDLYAGAMDEMYRGQQRSHVGPRPFMLYHAKRLEFAVEYLNSIEALRLAGQAKAKGDRAKQLEHLEKAVESMYNALSALGEVARDNSDRGVIAVLNEYGYRPLKAEFEAVEKAARK
ncbi:MAG: hypothetical protein HYS12_18880 [Planctomycetes bacterium]|nr:hypothetical protein [Planctomycetota bacterium]